MRLWEKFKAWRRGEVMIPGASRGRCFKKKDGSTSDGIKKAKAKPTAKLIGITVIRANGDVEVIRG